MRLSLMFIGHRAFALDRLHVSKTFLQLQTIHDTHILVVIDCICKCLQTSCVTFKLHHSALGWLYFCVTVNMLTQMNYTGLCHCWASLQNCYNVVAVGNQSGFHNWSLIWPNQSKLKKLCVVVDFLIVLEINQNYAWIWLDHFVVSWNELNCDWSLVSTH